MDRIRYCSLVFLLFTIAVYLYSSSIVEGLPNRGSDFEQDHFLALSAAIGQNPYQFLHTEETLSVIRVNHPPAIGLIFYPLSFLTLDSAYVVFCIVSVLVFTSALFFLCLELRIKRSATIVIVLAALIWWPSVFAVQVGSLSLLIAGLLTTGWIFYRRGHLQIPCMLCALAIHLKLYPALLFLQFALSRSWGRLIWTFFWVLVLGGLSGLFFGFYVWSDFLKVVLLYREHAAGYLLNISLIGLSEKLFGAPQSWISPLFNYPAAINLIAGISSLILLAISGQHWFRKKHDPCNFQIAICLMILISPASWSHALTLCILPLIVATSQGRISLASSAFLLLLLGAPCLGIANLIVGTLEISPPWSPLFGAIFILPTVGLLSLFFLLVSSQACEKNNG